MKELTRIACDEKLLKRALCISLVVGTLLALINHPEVFFSGKISFKVSLQILLTYAVPFCVSLTSSTLQKREHIRETANKLD